MPARGLDGEQCEGVSEVTTTIVQAHGSTNRARDGEAVAVFEQQQSIAHEHIDKRTHRDARSSRTEKQ